MSGFALLPYLRFNYLFLPVVLKRAPISLILLFAFFMLQAHNMMPHQHDIPKAHSHSHHDGQHHHHDKSPASPANDADHSAEFGKAIIKPANGKYELSPLKFIPLFQPASQTEIAGLIKIILQARPLLPDYLIPPDPYLQGTELRGPPSFI